VIGNQNGNQAAKGAIIGALAGGLLGGGIGNYLDKQAQELAQLAETKRTEDGIVTTLKSNLLFDTAKADLKPMAVDSVGQLADIIKKSKLGNCGEQSCLAFKYLITRGAPGLGIIEWVSGNHTFVVLGMQASVAKESSGSFATAPEWGPDAVVCDPWYHEWFAVSSASDWKTKMKRIAADAQRLSVSDVNAMESTAWRFVRLAYLAHGDPEITRAACGAKPARTSAERNLLPVADRDRRDGVGVR
jgi:hypothetical protein